MAQLAGMSFTAVVAIAVILACELPAQAMDPSELETCHLLAAATDGSNLASSMSFAAMCEGANKDDVSTYCTLLSKNLQYDPADTHLKYFVGAKPMCRDAKSLQALCQNVRSFDGYETLKET